MSAPEPEQAVTVMSEGQAFFLYSQGKKQAVKLFYVPGDPDDIGSIYWCQVHERARRPGQSFALSTLTDVYIGKQTPSFSANSAAASAPEDHCFSICSETSTLDLEAGDANSVAIWLFGINYVLANEGKMVVSSQPDETSPEGASQTPAETKSVEPASGAAAAPASVTEVPKKGRRYTVTSSQQAAAAQATANASFDDGNAAVPFTASTSDPLYVIKVGDAMTRYQVTPTGEQRATQVKVFFAKNAPGRRVTPGQAKARSVPEGSVDNVEEAIGSFYIVPADVPKSWSIVSQPTATRIPLDDLTDLYLGPGDANFAPFMSTIAQQQACFTIATSSDGAFSFETASRATLSAWLACINALLSESGATMEVETAPSIPQSTTGAPAVATPEQPANAQQAPTRTRRLTVRSTDASAAAAAAKAAPAAAAAVAEASASSAAASRESLIRAIARGLPFIIHPENERVILSLDRATSNLVLRNGKTPEEAAMQVVRSKLSLKTLADLYVGKSRPPFSDAKPGSPAQLANRRLCMSLVDASGKEWALEADSQETFACFLSAFTHALAFAGRGTTEVEATTAPTAAQTAAPAASTAAAAAAGAQKGNRRFSVMPLKPGAGAPAAPAAAPAPAAEAKPAASSTTSVPEPAPATAAAASSASMGVDDYLMNMARQGTEFMGFAERRGQIIRNAVNLFYVSPAELRALRHGPMADAVGQIRPDTRGRLCWCGAGKRELRPRAYIEFGDITDIYLGKQTKLLAHPALKDVAADRAFSILTPNNQLDLEAKSSAALHAWLDLVQKLIVATGKSVVTDGKADAAAPSAEADQRLVSKKQSKRFSVLATDGSRNADAVAAAAAARQAAAAEPDISEEDASVQRKMAIFQSPKVRFMIQGAPFTRYYNKKSGEDCQEDVLLFLQPNEEGGTLCWCPAADSSSRTIRPEATMRIAAITQIYTGRSTRALKALVPSEVDGKALITLVAEKRVLGIRAGSVEIAERWLAGIQAIIENLGAAMEEDGPGAAGSTNSTGASSPTESTTAAQTSAAEPSKDAAAAPSSKSGRRFTILKNQAPTLPTSAPPTAAPAATPSASSQTAQSAPKPPPKFELTQAQTAAIQTLARGLIVSEVTLVRGGETIATRKRLIYVAPPPQSASLALVTEDATEEEIRAAVDGATKAAANTAAQAGTARCRVFLISGLKDVIIGRDDPIWQMPGAAKVVRGERVFSIKSNVASAHIEAMSKDDVKVFLAAIQALVNAAGKEAYVEDRLPGSGDASTKTGASRRMSLLNAMKNPPVPSSSSGPKTAPFISAAHGSHFIMYRPLPGSDPADDVVVHTDIQLFHVLDTETPSSAAVTGTGGGVLCWIIPSSSPTQPPQRKMVRLSALRAILRGKQTSCLRNSCAGRAPSALCFSLVFAGGIVLDLEADSAAHVDGWLRSIAAALRKVYPGRPANEGGLELVPVTRHVDVEHTRDLVMQGTEHSSAVEAVALDGGKGPGVVVSISTGGSALKKRRVWIDVTAGESGALVWGPEITEGDMNVGFSGVEGQLMLDAVRTLHLGVGDSATLSKLYAERNPVIVSPDACLTLTTQGALEEVNIVFSSVDDATLVMQAMDQLMIEGQYHAYEAERAQREAEKAQAAEQGQSLPTMMSLDNDTTMTMLSDGSLFYCASDMVTAEAIREVDGSNVPITKDQCRVRVGHKQRYGHRGGGLIWAAPVPVTLQRVSDASEDDTDAWEAAANEQGNFLPIQEISEIVVGFQHPTFKAPVVQAAGFDSACAFTLITRRGLELSLVAMSSEEAVAWLLGIQTLLVSLGGAAVALTTDGSSGSVADPKPQTETKPASAAAAPSASEPEPAHSGPTVGGRRFTVLASAVANSATASSAAYATGPGRSSYAIPDDIPDDPTQALMQLAARSKQSGQHLVGVSPEATIAMMMRGREFFFYNEKADHPVRVVFRYNYISTAEREAMAKAAGGPAPEGSAGDLSKGLFEWRVVGSPVTSPPMGSIALAAITDVYVGKHTPVMKASVAAAAPADCCFSIKGVDGTTANLQADAPFQVSAWLFGLSQILSATGRDVVMDEQTEQAVSQAAATQAPTASALAAPRARRYTVLPSQAQKNAASLAASGASAGTSGNFTSGGSGRQAADPNIQPLVDGAPFFLYTPYGVTRVFAWFDTISETLEDAEAGKGAHALCFEPWTGTLNQQRFISSAKTRLLFDDLTEIFVGANAKNEAYKQTYEGRASVAENRLSFKAHENAKALRALHLEANSKNQRDTWLKGVQAIMNLRGQPVLATRDGGRTTVPLNQVAAAMVNEKQKPTEQKAPPPTLSVEEQKMFASHTPSSIVRKVLSNDPSLQVLSLANALRIMMAGDAFMLYPAARTEQTADALIKQNEFKPVQTVLRYIPAVGASLLHKGSITWIENQKERSASLDNLTDIVLGVAQPPFAQAVAAVTAGNKNVRAPLKSCAVILVFGSVSLCLEAMESAVATRWMWAINTLIRQSGRGTRQAEAAAEAAAAAAAAEAAAKAAAAAAAARMPAASRAPASAASSAAPASSAPAPAPTSTPPTESAAAQQQRKAALARDATVALMSAGQTFCLHSAEGPLGDFSVWYSLDDNAIAWVPRRKPRVVNDDKSNAIVITTIGEIVLGTGFAAFAKEAANLDAEACVALVSSDGKTLAIEADSKEQLQAWMSGISHILMVTGLSAVAQAESSDSGSKKSRRFTVLPTAAPTQVPAAAAATPAQTETKDSDEAVSPNATPFEKGVSFTQFVPDPTAPGGVASLDALVWCTSKGVLCWTNSRNSEALDGNKKPTRRFVASQQIHVGALTEICVGRQTPFTSGAYFSKFDEQQAEAIATLLGPDGFELHLMASSSAALDEWLDAIAKTCETLGRDVINENVEEMATQPAPSAAMASPTPAAPTPAASSSSSVRARRMTIRPYDRPAVLPQNPHEVLKQLGQRRPTLMALQPDSTLRMIAEGREGWTLVLRDPQTFKIMKIPIALFHSSDTQNGQAPLGSLCWCAPGKREEHPNRQLGLHLIEDVYVGKQTSVMQSPELNDVSGNLCVSLVSSTAPSTLTEINLICDNEDQLSSWLFGLNAVLTGGGDKSVTIEESTTVDKQGKQVNNRRFSVLPTY